MARRQTGFDFQLDQAAAVQDPPATDPTAQQAGDAGSAEPIPPGTDGQDVAPAAAGAGDGTRSPAGPPIATGEQPASGWHAMQLTVARDFAQPVAKAGAESGELRITFQTSSLPPFAGSYVDSRLLEVMRAGIGDQIARCRGLHSTLESSKTEHASILARTQSIEETRKAVLAAMPSDMAIQLSSINADLAAVTAKRTAHESTQAALLEAMTHELNALTSSATQVADRAISAEQVAVTDELAHASAQLAAVAGQFLTAYLVAWRRHCQLRTIDRSITARVLPRILAELGLPSQVEAQERSMLLANQKSVAGGSSEYALAGGTQRVELPALSSRPAKSDPASADYAATGGMHHVQSF